MFVHLRLHSEFSIQDSIVRLDEAVSAAAADSQPALALTDLNNLFGAITFYQAAQKRGIQPILGADVAVQGLLPDTPPSSSTGREPPPLPRMLLLAQNRQGYLNLCELLSHIWLEGSSHPSGPCVPWDWLRAHSEGLILLSGAQAGPVGMALLAGNSEQAQAIARQCMQAFAGRFYLELQRAGRSSDEPYIAAALELASALALPVVATHPIQFMQPDAFDVHEVRVCIAQGHTLGDQRRPRRFTQQQYFHTTEQMQALFADIPSALANTVEIARRTHLTLQLGKPCLPDYPVPDGLDMDTFFRQQAQQGLQQRLIQLYPDSEQRQQQADRYAQRLQFELDTIIQMGFAGYFLIVADFIDWARHNACPVGPGRGSGAGSLVAYVLGITDLDPLHYKLLFERFLNPERVSMPDFDIDFCQANRDRVIDYVKSRYGTAAVSQIATFGTMAARASIRDVGRVLDLSYSFCDKISKLIPNNPGKPITLQNPPADLQQKLAHLDDEQRKDAESKYALLASAELASRVSTDEETRMLVEMAQRIEGLTRNVGMHAGGVIIAPGQLTDFCPLYQQPGSPATISQYDKDAVEAVGLVKFDFLGLATLTIMEQARELIRSRRSGMQDFCFEHIPLDDAATYTLFQNGCTEAVFQFESPGMRKMLKQAQPTRLEDLIALNALYRPGPMSLIPDFISYKHGKKEVSYPHPLLADVLAETYGIIVYQEQVMQTAQILGGYSLGGADLLRRAMGKKKAEEMAQHRITFREGAAKNGLSQKQADDIFDLMERFAGYGFNKSHAAAYSLLAYQTAWLKVHYTVEFFCANMTVELDNTDKLKVLFDDATSMGLCFASPDINRSTYRFFPLDDHTISYGLGAIKGVGEAAINAIVAARESGGPFASLFDFCNRVGRTHLNRRTVEALIRSGALDSIHPNRAALFEGAGLALEYASSQAASAGQGSLFDMLTDSHGHSMQEPDLPTVPVWSVRERLAHEKAVLGLYLSGHPFDIYASEIRRFVPSQIARYSDDGEQNDSAAPSETQHYRSRQGSVILAGIVSELRTFNNKPGKQRNPNAAMFRLTDNSASIDALVPEDLWNMRGALLQEEAPIIVQASAYFDKFTQAMRLHVHHIWDLSTARCRFGQYLRISLPEQPARADGADILGHVQQMVHTFPPLQEGLDDGDSPPIMRSLPVRLHLRLHTRMPAHPPDIRMAYALAMSDQPAQQADTPQTDSYQTLEGELALGDAARIYPSDAALAAWQTACAGCTAEVVYPTTSDDTTSPY